MDGIQARTLARLTFNYILFVWDGANLVTPRSIFGMKKGKKLENGKLAYWKNAFVYILK